MPVRPTKVSSGGGGAPTGSAGGVLSDEYPNPSFSSPIEIDDINELTTNSGVTIEEVLIKDNTVTASSFIGPLDGTAVRARSLQSATSDVTTNGSAEPIGGQVLTAINAGSASWQAAGGGLQPGVVPNLLTVAHPTLGSWWGNAPIYGGTAMITTTSIGYGLSLFGPLAIAAVATGVQVDSVAASNQGCGWYNLSTSETDLAHRPWIRQRVKISATDTDQGVYIGWSPPSSPFGAGGSTIQTNSVLMTVDNTTGSWGDTTWKIRSRASGSITTIDTLVPFTATHDYEVYLSADATTVTWAIYDRTSSIAYGAAAVAIANAPSSTTGLGVVYYGMSGAGGASLRLTWGPNTRGHFGPA